MGVKIMVQRDAGHLIRSRVTQDLGVFRRVKPNIRDVDRLPSLIAQELGG